VVRSAPRQAGRQAGRQEYGNCGVRPVGQILHESGTHLSKTAEESCSNNYVYSTIYGRVIIAEPVGLSGAGVVTHAFTEETIAKGENASHFTHEKRYAIPVKR